MFLLKSYFMMKCIFLRYKALFFYLFLYVGIAGDFYLQASSSTKEAKKAWWQRGWDYLKKNKKYVGYVGAAILSGGAAVHALNRFGGYGGMQVFGNGGEKSSSHNNNTRVPWSLWGGIKNTFAVASLTAAEEETLKKYYNGDEVDRISYYGGSIPKDARAFLRDHPAIMERFLTNVDRKNIDLLLKKDPRYEKIKNDPQKINEIVFLLKQCFAYQRFVRGVDLKKYLNFRYEHESRKQILLFNLPESKINDEDEINQLRADIFIFLSSKPKYFYKNDLVMSIKNLIIDCFKKNKLSIEDFLRESFYAMIGMEHWAEESGIIIDILKKGQTIYEAFGNELNK